MLLNLRCKLDRFNSKIYLILSRLGRIFQLYLALLSLWICDTGGGGACPNSDWYYYNSYCYLPSTINGTLGQTWSFCWGQGGGTKITSISDQQELDFVISISYVHLRCFTCFNVVSQNTRNSPVAIEASEMPTLVKHPTYLTLLCANKIATTFR